MHSILKGNGARATRAREPLVIKALWYLADDPDAIEILRQTSSTLRVRIDSDAALRASYLLFKYSKHLVLYAVCLRTPHALTPSVFFTLTSMGATLPKLLVEAFVSYNVVPSAHNSWAAYVPQDTIDHLVAWGFKLYADSLVVAAPESGVVPNDDIAAFLNIMNFLSPNLDELSKIVYENYFLPVLVPSHHSFWLTFYGHARRLLRLDPEMAHHIIKNSAIDPVKATDRFVYEALMDPKTTKPTILELSMFGYYITENVALRVLMNPAIVQNPNTQISSLQLLKEVLPEETLTTYLQKALKMLMKSIPTLPDTIVNSSSKAPQQLDALLREFKQVLPDSAMCSVLLAPPPSYESRQNRTLPFMTLLGQTYGGVSDTVWQVVCAEYGAKHAFVAAFLVDVVIGGTISTGNENEDTKASNARNLKEGKLNAVADSPNSPGRENTDTDNDTMVVVAPDGVIRRKSIAILGLPSRKGSRVQSSSSSTLSLSSALSLSSTALQSGAPSASPGSGGVAMVRNRASTYDPRYKTQPAQEQEEYDSSDDRDRDVAARETMQAMLEGVNVPLDVGMLIPILRAVIIMGSVRSRVVDFMARVEREILNAAFSPTAIMDYDSETLSRLSRSKWISSLYRNVIDSQAWMHSVMSTSELTVLEGLKPTAGTSTADISFKSKRRTGHPLIPGVFAGPAFSELLESAGDASVVELDRGPAPMSVAAVARSVRMRRQKSVSGALPMPVPGGNRTSVFEPLRNSVLQPPPQQGNADIRKFYKSCEELVLLLEGAAQSGVNVSAAGRPGSEVGGMVPEGPFGKWLVEKDQRTKSWWDRPVSGSSWLSGTPSWF
ncbi:hypothetical protein HDU78_005422 [Chytriomyces hyalinus]|nr:hypothetical protein HDU78_005422 [Chytriomyces hyalinus]